MGKENLGIETLTIGVSRDGMRTYRDELNHIVLKETQSRLDDVTDFEGAINQCWQGQSRDKFLKDFKEDREKIKRDLKEEYKDLEARLEELENQFFAQDDRLMEGE